MMPHTHTTAKESLSRYLDGDLAADEAASLAAQLSRDPELKRELAQLKAVRSAVRHQATPLNDAAAETARLRTFARFRAGVETQQWKTTPRSKPSVSLRSWRPILVTTLGAFVVVGAYLLPSPVSAPSVVNAPIAPIAPTVDLPGEREMSLMFDLHDAHGAPLSTEDAALQRHSTARAQADLLDYADATLAETL